MTYGAKFENTAGEMLLIDVGVAPWFVGKGVPGDPIGWTTPTGLGWDVNGVTFAVPGAGRRLIAVTLPVNSGDAWYSTTALIPGSGVVVQIYRPTGSGAGFITPEVYAFAIGTRPPASSGYGMRIRDAANLIVMDTGSPPLGVQQVVATSAGVAPITLAGLPGKPAFILFDLAKEVGQTIAGTFSRDVWYYQCAFKRASDSSLEAGYKPVYQYVQDAGGTYTDFYGSTSSQAIPIINAANYD